MKANNSAALRALPSVDRLLGLPEGVALIDAYGRDVVLEMARAVLDDLRAMLQREEEAGDASADGVLARVSARLAYHTRPTLRAVINATGVIIHTNLGRAPLCENAQQAMLGVAMGYSTLEFDLENGKRGSRAIHAENLLQEITGAEAALVVNNNASAMLLVLSALTQGREVIVSRGQLVEIGGGVRVPDILKQSGAQLVEVGTTNRTRAGDYADAITAQTAAILRVHSSNFRVIGFTEDAPLDALAQIAHTHNALLIDDIGSGAFLDTALFGLTHEPTVQESLRAGADVVAFSGDKLLGGPQAGILAGKREVIERLKRHPLARAIRADKLCLSALVATLQHYRRGDALTQIPVWQMIARPLDDIRTTAQTWRDTLTAHGVPAGVIEGESTVGGGSLPGDTLPTVLVTVDHPHPDSFMKALREGKTPVIARILHDRVVFDPRTVFTSVQVEALLGAIRHTYETSTP